MSSGTKVYDSINQPARLDAVLEAIAKTEKIIILTGPEVSSTSGMLALTQTIMFSSNAFTSQMPLRTMITDCSAHDRDLFQLAEDQLASYNKVMAARRIQARSNPINAFHQYFHRVLQQKHVVKYLTTSFDALEVHKKRTVESKVIRMHGDNRFLRCCTPGCSGVSEKDTAGLDASLLSGATITCTHCTQAGELLVLFVADLWINIPASCASDDLVSRAEVVLLYFSSTRVWCRELISHYLTAQKPATSRRPAPAASSFYLRPAVQGSLGIDMLPGGKLRNKIVAAAECADLLLIAGISLQSDEILELVREIVEQIHGRYGGVVYIGAQPIRGRGTKYYIDFHLKMDVNECAERLLGVMDRLKDSDTSMGPVTDVDNDKSDIWFEIISNELESLVCEEEPENTASRCYLCNLGLEECLLHCKRCGDHLCYTGPYPTSQTAPCVMLQVFRDEVNKPSVQEEIEGFSCFHCWNQSEEGAYPHYVRPAPWVAVRERGRPAPRMVMIIYFLDQFWPQAKHLRNHVAGKWLSRGWSAHVEPVRLETLAEQGTVLPNLSWEADTYNMFIIYITHGISASKTYQISPTTSYPAPRFIDHTLVPARNLVARARHSLVFFAACGHPFQTPQGVWDLQLWLNKSNLVDTVMGCLNEKLTPAFLVCFLGKLTTNMADDIISPEDAVECWLSDDIAVSHTDLIYLQKMSPPMMWLFSPFNSRPLGKELPHLLTALRIAAVLEPSRRYISEELHNQIQLFKQNLDALLVDQKHGTEYRHYCYYIFDLSYDVKPNSTDEELLEALRKHHALLMATKRELKVRKKKMSLATRNRQLRELAVNAGLELVGHTEGSFPTDVYCMDAITHDKLDPRKMLIQGVDRGGQSKKPSGANPKNVNNPTSVPPPAKDNPFGSGYVDTETVLKDKRFKILDHGTVYGFARAPDETYSMVFAVQFQDRDSLGETEKEAVDVFIDFLPKAAAHAYEVKVNGAQNVVRKRVGLLYSVGWRPGTTRGEMVAVYAAQKVQDKHDPTHYIDLYDSQEVVNSAWIVLQESLSPRAVLMTIDTLADTAVPMFGSQSSDIASHGPSLGSNMAASQHDPDGNGFANKMHVDRDMDSLPEYYGKVFAFGQWIHIDKEGRLVEKERIKQAIPDGLFVIPGYKVAFDLGAATVIKGIWRGGMDLHGTTTSKVDLEQGITRWGMSIQTNRGLCQRMRSGKGEIFGVHERLRQYYNILSAGASADMDNEDV
ncbi:hypothetical protein RSAG8_13360, partial [Rhizoctonia solani AG-8 WAC10335]